MPGWQLKAASHSTCEHPVGAVASMKCSRDLQIATQLEATCVILLSRVPNQLIEAAACFVFAEGVEQLTRFSNSMWLGELRCY